MDISILLVEDDPQISEILMDTLTETGFTVLLAATGEAAIAKLDEEQGRIRAVLTDIRLPGRIDGWEIGRHARSMSPTIPVVYMSGDQAANWSAQGVPDSVMVPKPFVPAQLVTAVSTLLNAVDVSKAPKEE